MTTTFWAGILGQTAAFRNVLNCQVTNLLVQKMASPPRYIRELKIETLGNLRWRRFRGDGDRTERIYIQQMMMSRPVEVAVAPRTSLS